MAKEDMRSCGKCGGSFDSKLEGVMCLECQCLLCALCQDRMEGKCPLCNGALDNEDQIRTCRVCGCTDDNCSQCVETTGQPCHWVEADLCSRCKDEMEAAIDVAIEEFVAIVDAEAAGDFRIPGAEAARNTDLTRCYDPEAEG